eukprot:1161383-Pelagomonas_calceolata.AAC.2
MVRHASKTSAADPQALHPCSINRKGKPSYKHQPSQQSSPRPYLLCDCAPSSALARSPNQLASNYSGPRTCARATSSALASCARAASSALARAVCDSSALTACRSAIWWVRKFVQIAQHLPTGSSNRT